MNLFPIFLLPRFDWVSCILPGLCTAVEEVHLPISPGDRMGGLPGRTRYAGPIIEMKDNFVIMPRDFPERGLAEPRIPGALP